MAGSHAHTGSRRWLRRGAAIAAGTFVLLSSSPAQTQPATELPQEGAATNRAYIAPVNFTVVDPAATATAAAVRGEILPIVVRKDDNVATAVVQEFEDAFARTRAAYLDALATASRTRPFARADLDDANFRSFVRDFQTSNPLFPVDLVLAQTWANGGDAAPTRERLSRALRASMENTWIARLRPASTVFISSLAPEDRIRTWGEAAPHTRAIDPHQIRTPDAAAQELRQALDLADHGASGFLAGLLRPNLVEDAHLTGLLLHERLGTRTAHRSYRKNEYIAAAGATLDHITTLALAHLARSGITPLEQPASSETSPVTEDDVAMPSPLSGAAESVPERGRSRLPPWIIVTAVVFLGGVGASVIWWRRRPAARKSPPSEWLDQPAAATPPAGLREALIPHLARELKNRLVQALFAQRQELLQNEDAASQRVAELEQRLARLQPAIAAKIRGYEQRIQSLEAELAEKDQETRDLIRAKLVLARKELEEEITRHRLDLN